MAYAFIALWPLELPYYEGDYVQVMPLDSMMDSGMHSEECRKSKTVAKRNVNVYTASKDIEKGNDHVKGRMFW